MQELTNKFIEKYVEDATGKKMFCPEGQEFRFVDGLSAEMMSKKDSTTYMRLSHALAALFIFVDEVSYARKLLDKYGWPIRDEWEHTKAIFASTLVFDQKKYDLFAMKCPLLTCFMNVSPEKLKLAEEIIIKKELDPMKHTSLDMMFAENVCREFGYTKLLHMIEDKLNG